MIDSSRALVARRRYCGFIISIFSLAGCSKKSSQDTPAPVASVVAASSSAVAVDAASTVPRSGSTEPSAWTGAYSAKVGAVDPPPAAKEKTWTLDPGTAAVGKGTVNLTIGERGETRGDAKGPLGEMTISGTYDGHEVRANLVPVNPRAEGAMTGFMVLVTEGTALKGTLRAASRDARIVREASVELGKK